MPESAAHSHPALVRITHWINTVSFLALLVSGVAILLAHPRLYWGEIGNVDTPSLIDLPLPFMLGGQSGWGRYLHFFAAWICVLNGLLYVVSGLPGGALRGRLLPAGRIAQKNSLAYDLPQRLTYLAIIFGLFPLAIWTGFAMSPALVSVYPALVTTFGGQQSARTLHFFIAVSLILFLVVHLAMVWRAGFLSRMRGMITGRIG